MIEGSGLLVLGSSRQQRWLCVTTTTTLCRKLFWTCEVITRLAIYSFEL